MSTATRTSAGAVTGVHGLDAETLYRAVASRDRRLDGRFVLGVTSTGIYCRPSCPARTPQRQNVRYFAVPAAAVAAGFRACRRCRPDQVAARPHVADETGVVDRALTLIGQGVVDEDGVAGLARRLAVSERHLHRLLVESVGTGASALAQTRRAQTARTLLEQTALPVTDVAFASGFGSLRQFNDVIKAEYGASPSQLRRDPVHPDRPADAGCVALRLPVTVPWDGRRLLAFLGARAIAGVERTAGDCYLRTIATPTGVAFISVRPGDDVVHVEVRTRELSDVGVAMQTVRRLCDLSADIGSIETTLATHPLFASLVRRRPGLRVPGGASGWEILVRAIVGQQVSVLAARTMLGRLVVRCGASFADRGDDTLGVDRIFPDAAAVAEADLTAMGLTGRREATLRAAAEAVTRGDLLLDPGDDVLEARRRLLELPGVGPWTAEYVAMRALGDPNAWPATDLVLTRAAPQVDVDRLQPWRAYAAIHLWTRDSEERS
jgi:AraC family transcriptional regulator of adaptative response / DNA-3-methyladenine glycosylase II